MFSNNRTVPEPLLRFGLLLGHITSDEIHCLLRIDSTGIDRESVKQQIVPVGFVVVS